MNKWLTDKLLLFHKHVSYKFQNCFTLLVAFLKIVLKTTEAAIIKNKDCIVSDD